VRSLTLPLSTDSAYFCSELCSAGKSVFIAQNTLGFDESATVKEHTDKGKKRLRATLPFHRFRRSIFFS